MATPITVPEIDDNVKEVTLVRWLKQEGDTVQQHEPVAEVETDKVTMEISAETAGRLQERVVEVGQTVQVGTVLAYLEASDEERSAGTQAKAPQPEPAGRDETTSEYTGPVTPVVQRIATEEGVDLNRVAGTGRRGRITKKDLLAYLKGRRAEPEPEPEKAALPAMASISEGEAPADEIVPLTSIRRRIAEHMVRSQQTSPHVTTVFEIDFSAVAHHLAAHKAAFARDGVKLTYTAYIIEATVQALKQYPIVNSRWRDDGILLKREINIGVATATEAGLLVPVLKQADQLSLLGLARTLNDLTRRARDQQLQPAEVQGGTFSLTNHGMGGSLFATPIIHQPQGGILGVGAIEKRVKVLEGDAIAVRPCAYASFTFDHRILDGATADGFLSAIKRTLEAWP